MTGLSVCTIFLFDGFAFHTRLRFYWDQYLAEMGQLLSQNLRFGSGPLDRRVLHSWLHKDICKTWIQFVSVTVICVTSHLVTTRRLKILLVECWICRDFEISWWWGFQLGVENKRQSGDLCVEVSATLGLIELLSQSNIPLVYWTSVQRKGILFGGFTCKSVSFFQVSGELLSLDNKLFFLSVISAIHC